MRELEDGELWKKMSLATTDCLSLSLNVEHSQAQKKNIISFHFADEMAEREAIVYCAWVWYWTSHMLTSNPEIMCLFRLSWAEH